MNTNIIKRLFLLIIAGCLVLGTKAQQRNVLSIPDITVQIGAVQLPIAIENTDELVGAQFDITLPTEATAETAATLTERATTHEVIVRHIRPDRKSVV